MPEPEEIERFRIWASPNYGSPRLWDLVITGRPRADQRLDIEICLRIDFPNLAKPHLERGAI